MREIGIYICNYNKRDMVAECVRHILKQTIRDKCDIYVVDNASTDGSVLNLKQIYGNKITILQNEENVGGAGGFGRGIRDALNKDYKYFMLVDNDAMLNEDVVEILRGYMEDNEDVGICGAKTVKLQNSNEIQDMGGCIDKDRYDWFGIMQNELNVGVDMVMDVDYVASCSCMARVSAVREFGGFPEDNFIYWDDVEWCTKCKRAGYRVVVNGNAETKHDFSSSGIENQFFRYYCNRNRFRYFVKFLDNSKLDDFWNKITEEVFVKICTFRAKGMEQSAKVSLYAFEDFVNDVTGRQNDRVLAFDKTETLLEKRIKGSKIITINMPSHDKCDYEKMERIVRYIKSINEVARINVSICENIINENSSEHLSLVLCNHVKEIKDDILPSVYIDGWINAVYDKDTYDVFSCFDEGLDSFRERYRKQFDRIIKKIRKD